MAETLTSCTPTTFRDPIWLHGFLASKQGVEGSSPSGPMSSINQLCSAVFCFA